MEQGAPTPRRAGALLVCLFALGALIRVLVGLDRSTPLYYPDEYIYSALARSIAHSGLPSLRGSSSHFLSILGPYLMAPAWWLGSVRASYHAAVSLGAVGFSAAVFPAYALARRARLNEWHALVVALLAVLVPSAAFVTCALTEGFAYPLFLVAALAAIDATVFPTRRRQLLAIGLMVALCLLRAQFIVVPLAFVLAGMASDRERLRRSLTKPVTVTAIVIAAVGAFAGAHFYTNLGGHWSTSIGLWFIIDVFVLCVSAGWALVPGAVVGLMDSWSSADPWRRAFGGFSVAVSAGLVLEAAYFDAVQQRVHERYVFYAVPLLAIACLIGLRSTRRLAYSRTAYCTAAAALLIASLATFRDADPSQSPTLLALQKLGTGPGAYLGWSVALALVSLVIARARVWRWVPIACVLMISGAFCIEATRVLLAYSPTAHPGGMRNVSLYRLGAPDDSALVTEGTSDGYVVMKSLFWTPGISRVLVLGGGESPDGFNSTPVRFGGDGIVDERGRRVDGPFAFPLDTTIVDPPTNAAWLPESPNLLILGLNRRDHELSTVAQVIAGTRARPRTLLMSLQSDVGSHTLIFRCGARQLERAIGASPVHVSLELGAGGVRTCRISLTRGAALDRDGSIVSGVRVLNLSLR